MALSYVRVYVAGLMLSMIYNVGAGILRAKGDSRTPFFILAVSGITNVILDLVFIGGFHWGVTGAAFATVLAQLISAIMVIRALLRTSGNSQLHFSKIRFHKSVLTKIFRLGIPIGFQSSLFPIANMMIQSSINSTGTDNIAAWALCGKLDFLVWLSVDSLAAAISTFVAQNYGAKLYDRANQGVPRGLAMTTCIVLAISAVLFLGCEQLGKLFINKESYDIIPLTGRLMRFLSPFYFLYVFGEVFAGALRGTGETFKPMLLTLLGTCLPRILWVLLTAPRNPTMIFILGSYPISWTLTAILLMAYYQIFHRRT
jgi:putative MATE family efflux protein